VTLTFAAVVCLAFVGQQLSGTWQGGISRLQHALGFSAHDIAAGQWWRIVTPNLTNGPSPPEFGPPGFRHLLVNLVGLLGVGPIVERKLGWLRTLLIVVVSGTVAYGWLMIPLPTAVYPDGSSAALYGLIGAFAALTITEPPRSRGARVLAAVIAVLAVAGIVGTPGVGLEVHLAGLVTGLLLGLIFVRARRTSAVVGAAAGVLAALLVTVAVRSVQLG
jgi:rhomboid protease GluP